MELKGEDMTHLRAGRLVRKTHRRIAFRGALDSLEADILEAQLLAGEEGSYYREALGEVLSFVREILSAEVNERPVGEGELFGLSLDALHEQSHNVREFFGFPHPLPDSSMGALALRLNTLRTRAREAELAAVRAFAPFAGDGAAPALSAAVSSDIIRAMNRLSSALYWLFCRCLSEKK